MPAGRYNRHANTTKNIGLSPFAKQRQSAGFTDADIDELAGEHFGPVEDNNIIMGSAADKLGIIFVFRFIQMRLFAGAFDKGFHGLA